MKLKNLILVLTVVTLVVSSCGGTISPRAYNEKVVSMHTKSWEYLEPRMEIIYAHEISKEDALKLVDSLRTRFDNDAKILRELKIPDAAKDYNNVTIHFFEYVRDSIVNLYGETLNFEPESKQWYKVWNEIDRRLKGRGSDIEDMIIAEQKKFAAEIGSKLQ